MLLLGKQSHYYAKQIRCVVAHLVVDEEPSEDVFARFKSVAEIGVFVITAKSVSTCHCLPSGVKCPEPKIAMFFKIDTENQLMNLILILKKNPFVSVNNDISPIST